jgi:hypothetical protein
LEVASFDRFDAYDFGLASRFWADLCTILDNHELNKNTLYILR